MYRDLTSDIITSSLLKRLWARIPATTENECWEWEGARTPKGYGRIGLTDPYTGQWRVEYAHRIVAMIASGSDIPAGMVAMHTCDNPPCSNPDHLRIGTYSDNAQDREDKGRRPGWSPPPSWFRKQRV